MMSSRFDDLDINEVLKKRLQRFRIELKIFDDDPGSKPELCNGESCPTVNSDDRGVVKQVQGTQNINFMMKGVDVFDLSCAGKLFDDVLLHKNLRESKPQNIMNHPIFHISYSDLHEVIQRGLLKQPVKSKVIFSHLNKYLFFLTSCHCSKSLVDASYETLVYHLLNTEEGKTPRWQPSKEDILMVFCNYGASRDLLESWDVPVMRGKLPLKAVQCDSYDPRLLNIPMVVHVLSLLLRRHKGMCYSVKELDSLLCMILTVSLDKYVMQMPASDGFGKLLEFIECILSAYPPLAWQELGKASELGRAMYIKFQHVTISDIYFIVHNLLSCPGFGVKLAQAFMCALVQGMGNRTAVHMDLVPVEHFRKIFKFDSLLNMDYFSQYYILLMVENIIITLIYSMKETKELKRIKKLLSNLRIKSPYSTEMVDYLLVKELISRIATTWKLGIADL